MKPGAYMVCFGGTRTAHRLACAIEDAGFEIRDTLCWLYGSGFPKSLDVSKAIDKMAGATREAGTPRVYADGTTGHWGVSDKFAQDAHTKSLTAGTPKLDTAPATPEAQQWSGWGTALKPAHEPIILARKPLQGTVAANVLRHGTGAINVDACRVPSGPDHAAKCASVVGLNSNRNGDCYGEWTGTRTDSYSAAGRWPPNVVHDGSPEVLDTGSAARFFASCPPSPDELRFHYSGKAGTDDRAGSRHPTIKPVALMRWLVRLIAPPGGTVLDPFAGSGTTGEAAMLEGRDALLIEREAQHAADIAHRIKRWSGADLPLLAEVAD